MTSTVQNLLKLIKEKEQLIKRKEEELIQTRKDAYAIFCFHF